MRSCTRPPPAASCRLSTRAAGKDLAADQHVDRRAKPLVKAPRQAFAAFGRIRADTLTGMAFSSLIALAIILTTMPANFLVIGIDQQQNLILVHQIRATGTPKLTQILATQ